MKKLFYLAFLGLMLFIAACSDYLELQPTDTVTELNAIKDAKTAQAALAGLYNSFSPLYSFSSRGLTGEFGSLSDEYNNILNINSWSLNSVDADNSTLSYVWSNMWGTIRRADNILALLPEVDAVPIDVKNQILAEAKCVRALNYMLMIQFWGELPYSESRDFRVRRNLPRTDISFIYSEIIADALEASEVLPQQYESEDLTRTRFTKGAANALLARLYLYSKDWAEAENSASSVIADNLYQLKADYEDVFTRNSGESILELFSSGSPSIHLASVYFFYPPSLGGGYRFIPTEEIKNAFESGDLRFTTSIGEDINGLFYINKYRDINGIGNFNELKIFRLAEQYLIRAEARAKQNDILGALSDINTIRNRAGLPDASASTQEQLLALIEQERFVELCFEGHRWIDLVRTDRVDEVMGAFNPVWNPRARLLPLPQSEIDNNPNMTQNPGY